ncbi:hypothetical protein QE445_004250, partial [Pantoea ananatis]|uniref:hypothetical protein n=1 Tax=Pantoea ananas TaxID=553 RepID=UPI00285FCA04
ASVTSDHNVTCFDYEVMISPLFRWPDLVFHFIAITPSLPSALESEPTSPPMYEHGVEASETTEAQTLLDMTRMPREQTRSADFFMTRVLRWLLSIPYLAAFTYMLKKTGKTLLHRKSSFSTVHAVLSAEPALSELLGDSEILAERITMPFR